MIWLFFVLLAVGSVITTDEVRRELKDEKIVYKCVLYNSDKGLILKDIMFPLYTCNTEDGDKILIAGKDLKDEKLDAILDKDTYFKLKEAEADKSMEPPQQAIRIKRTFLPFGGIGIGGGIGYGGVIGGFGGYPGFGGYGPGFFPGPGYGGGFRGGYGGGFGGGFFG